MSTRWSCPSCSGTSRRAWARLRRWSGPGPLERSRTAGTAIAALTIALSGTAFMAGSVFAVAHEPPLLVPAILLAVPGFLGWILPWFVYRKLAAKRGKVVAELVEKKYDEIYEICGKGTQLL